MPTSITQRDIAERYFDDRQRRIEAELRENESGRELARGLLDWLDASPLAEASAIRSDPENGLLTLQEAASFLGVTGQTIHAWRKRGIIEGLRYGEEWRFQRDELIRAGQTTQPLEGLLREAAALRKESKDNKAIEKRDKSAPCVILRPLQDADATPYTEREPMRRKKRRKPRGWIKRGDRYYFNFTEHKIRVRDVIRNAFTEQEADTEVMKRRIAIREGRDGEPDKSMLFDEFLETIFLPWSKPRKRTSKLDEHFAEIFRNAPEFKSKRLAEITPLMIDQYMQRRLKETTQRGETRSSGSVNRERATLSVIFQRAVKARLIAHNPVREVEQLPYYPKERKVITPEQEALIMSKLTGRMARFKPIFIIGMYTGMRRGEILKMRWRDVNFETRRIRIPAENAKSKKDQFVEMNSIVADSLNELRNGAADSSLVFSGRGFSPGTVTQTFSKLCNELELDDITFHCSRHSISTRFKDNNENPFVIRDNMRHSHVQITEGYTHSTPGTGDRPVDKLEKYALWRSSDTDLPQEKSQPE